jgi:hypothetical protein
MSYDIEPNSAKLEDVHRFRLKRTLAVFATFVKLLDNLGSTWRPGNPG